MRPYKANPDNPRVGVYNPFVWRGWWDFGTGRSAISAATALTRYFVP